MGIAPFLKLNEKKVDYETTKQIFARRDMPLNGNAYTNAPIVVECTPDGGSRPGIGFHNPGKEGAALFLQDGNLLLFKNTGEFYKINMEYIGTHE